MISMVALYFEGYFVHIIGHGYLGSILLRMILGVIMLSTLYIVAGREIFSWSKRSGRYAFLCGIFPLIFNSIVLTISVVETYQNPFRRLHDDWWCKALIFLALALMIGLFEEGLFRGIIANGLVKMMPKTKAGLYKAIIISSILFGFVHIVWYLLDIEYFTLSSIVQMMISIFRIGCIGMLLAAIYYKTKNIWACILLHAMIDFILFLNNPLTGGVVSHSYVDKGVHENALLMLALVTAIISIPNLVIAILIMRKLDPEECVMWKSDDVDKEEVLEAVS